MYSQDLQDYIRQLSTIAQVRPRDVSILDDILACFIGILGNTIRADTDPAWDLLKVSVKLLFLSDGLSRLEADAQIDGAHYLVALGFEQTGELLARLDEDERQDTPRPLESDHWYRLTLALLHYLAGGHRVQALSVMRHLQRMAGERGQNNEYPQAAEALRLFYSARLEAEQGTSVSADWRNLLLGARQPTSPQEIRILNLARQVSQRRDIVLGALGQGDEQGWLMRRGVESGAADFWTAYLRRLSDRGITTFTKEQSGPGFDVWLRSGHDLLVILPTGSGKTIIGELRTALALAAGQQAIWMLPTRALVRQTKRDLQRAFEPLNVVVEELPTTEDFIPLFAEGLPQLHTIAATTPEKLSALLRSNQKAVENVGVVVLDEAQILLEDRGITAEFVLQQIRRFAPSCDIVLMSAFGDFREPLKEFLDKLGKKVVPLVSDTRPTRRIYGVITNAGSDDRQYPVALLYPPGIQSESGETANPFTITLKELKLPSNLTTPDIAFRFAKAITSSQIRTALFVHQKVSTETKAKMLAKRNKARDLLDGDISRLRVELGRESTVEETGVKGVAPHHAGLSPLEQHIVEKWVRDGIVTTVVATPTLAQGVNLPFDMSIISSAYRFNKSTGSNEEIPHTELLNMAGRAGRAGYVSDGIGLIAVRRYSGSLVKTLDAQRTIFFRSRKLTNQRIGLSRLLALALKARVDATEWVVELHDTSFSEAQSLISFALDAAEGESDTASAISNRIRQFPSVQQLSSGEIKQAATALAELVENIRQQTIDDPGLVTTLKRTGIPIEVLRYFQSEIHSTTDLRGRTPEELLMWSHEVVKASLRNCSSRGWYKSLIQGADLNMMFASISLWQAGSPIAEIEKIWQLRRGSTRQNRIAIGDFLNHRLPLFAQFWGALAVCEEITYGGSTLVRSELALQRFPVFIREGVQTLEELEWLRAIGNVDRVLAHRLAKTSSPISGIQNLRKFIRGQLQKWWKNSGAIPRQLVEPYRTALLSVLEEIYSGQR